MRDGRVLVVTPTYNEAENLEAFVRRLRSAVPEAHLRVVDDASPDGTGGIADRLAEQDAKISVEHRPRKLGLGSAYLSGFRWGMAQGFDVLCEMDADLSHEPEALPALLAALEAGADLAVGSRNVSGGAIVGWGPGRLLMSKGGSLYARACLGVAVQDLTSGFKAFRRKAFEHIELDEVVSEGYAFQIEMTYRALLAGLKVVEVPICFVDRRAGQSKMSARIFWEAVTVVWRLRARLG